MVKGGDKAVDSSVARLILCLTPPHLHMRQRSHLQSVSPFSSVSRRSPAPM